MANDKGMDGSYGMSARKAMASNLAHPDSNFEVGPMGAGRTPVKDIAAGEMRDGERGIGGAIQHTKGMQPAQAAPDHGSMNAGGRRDFVRDSKA